MSLGHGTNQSNSLECNSTLTNILAIDCEEHATQEEKCRKNYNFLATHRAAHSWNLESLHLFVCSGHLLRSLLNLSIFESWLLFGWSEFKWLIRYVSRVCQSSPRESSSHRWLWSRVCVPLDHHLVQLCPLSLSVSWVIKARITPLISEHIEAGLAWSVWLMRLRARASSRQVSASALTSGQLYVKRRPQTDLWRLMKTLSPVTGLLVWYYYHEKLTSRISVATWSRATCFAGSLRIVVFIYSPWGCVFVVCLLVCSLACSQEVINFDRLNQWRFSRLTCKWALNYWGQRLNSAHTSILNSQFLWLEIPNLKVRLVLLVEMNKLKWLGRQAISSVCLCVASLRQTNGITDDWNSGSRSDTQRIRLSYEPTFFYISSESLYLFWCSDCSTL